MGIGRWRLVLPDLPLTENQLKQLGWFVYMKDERPRSGLRAYFIQKEDLADASVIYAIGDALRWW